MTAPRDNVAPFRSATPVSARVDRAWGQGFKAGQDDLLRWAGLAAVLATFRALRAHRVPPFVVGFVTMVLALCVIPCAVVILCARYLWARKVKRPKLELVQFPDGDTF